MCCKRSWCRAASVTTGAMMPRTVDDASGRLWVLSGDDPDLLAVVIAILELGDHGPDGEFSLIGPDGENDLDEEQNESPRR